MGNQWLLRVVATLLMTLILVMVGLGFGQVVLRKLFQRGYSDINLFLQFAVLWIAFLGSILATARQRHIRIDALTQVFSPGANRWVLAVVNLTGLGLCVVLSRAGFTFYDEFSVSAWGWGENPIAYLSFLVGFGIVALEFLIQFLECLFPEKNGEKARQAPEVRPPPPHADGQAAGNAEAAS